MIIKIDNIKINTQATARKNPNPDTRLLIARKTSDVQVIGGSATSAVTYDTLDYDNSDMTLTDLGVLSSDAAFRVQSEGAYTVKASVNISVAAAGDVRIKVTSSGTVIDSRRYVLDVGVQSIDIESTAFYNDRDLITIQVQNQTGSNVTLLNTDSTASSKIVIKEIK